MEYTYSFIIPHHNSPELLNRCLDSIPQREDIQVIVVDDNSIEDKRPNVSRHDVEIVYIDASHTKGAGHARNEGLARAKGKWILFPDCDDYYSSELISVLDSYRNKDIDVLYFNFHHFDSIAEEQLKDRELQKRIQNYGGDNNDLEYIKFRNNTPWAKMIRRSYIEQHTMYYEEVPNGNDVLFSLFVASYTNRVAVDNRKLYTYVKTPNSIATSKQDPNKILCRVTHKVKHNRFNEYLGRKDWNTPVMQYVFSITRRMPKMQAIKTLATLIANSIAMISNRNEWVTLINEHR